MSSVNLSELKAELNNLKIKISEIESFDNEVPHHLLHRYYKINELINLKELVSKTSIDQLVCKFF